MNPGALRLLATGVAFATMGVDATVTPVGGVAVGTKVVWLQASDETMPVGHDLARREPRRLLAVPVSDVPDLPRGSMIVAVPAGGTVARTWKVESIDRAEADQWRAIVRAVGA